MGFVYTENADNFGWFQNCMLFQDPTGGKLVSNVTSIPNKQHDPWVGDFKCIHWLGRAENCESCKREMNPAGNLSFIIE
jgi:hypothetical protein